MSTGTERMRSTSLLLLALAAILALLLALPGETVTTRYLNDLIVTLDGAYRVASGQVPSRDFHTPLGPLAYYIPAAGLALSGSPGGAMPLAMALTTLVLALPLAYILHSRLRLVIALPFGAFLLFILIVPINLGESITALSFAKYYNRIGWACLATLLIMYLRPERPHAHHILLDTLCAALLTLVMVYTKITYGLVASAFLIFMLFDAYQRRWATGALGLVVTTGIVIEAVWQSSAIYFADLYLALEVGGRLRGTWGQIIDHILGNLADYVLLALLAGFALRRTRSVRDAFFYAFCAAAGFLIINQNFQAWGIITLHAAAAVAVESILRAQIDDGANPFEQRWSLGAGVKLVFLALVLPTVVHCTAALGLHAVAASTGAGQVLSLPHFERVRLANLWTWGEYDTAVQYLTAVQDGVQALADLKATKESVFVLDLGNPFPMALGAPPPKGDTPWLQWDRTLNATAFIPPDRLLEEVTFVMLPRLTGDAAKAQPAAASPGTVYGSYIAINFDLLRETEHWKIYRRPQSSKPQAALRKADAP